MVKVAPGTRDVQVIAFIPALIGLSTSPGLYWPGLVELPVFPPVFPPLFPGVEGDALSLPEQLLILFIHASKAPFIKLRST